MPCHVAPQTAPSMMPAAWRLLAPAPPARRALASQALRCASSGGRRRRGDPRPGSFWHKWSHHSQQQFYQRVGLEQDLAYERRMGPLEARGKAKRVNELDDYDDLAFGLDSEDVDEEYYVEDELEGAGADDGAIDGSADEQRDGSVGAIRERVYLDEDVDAARRAELLELLDEVGPERLTAEPPEPTRRPGAEFAKKSADDFADITMMREAQTKSLAIVPTFAAQAQMRRGGQLKPGALFAYVLHTRYVSKVTKDGKRRTYSVLAVVGNGEGAAGFGMGKDRDASSALYKATVAARKNMVYVERFDGRTLFHPMDEYFAANKLVIRMRKANSGTRCNWTCWKILSAFGITDVSIKCHGSRNKMGITHALFNALQRMQTAQTTADRRGIRVLDLTPRTRADRGGAGRHSLPVGFPAK